MSVGQWSDLQICAVLTKHCIDNVCMHLLFGNIF